MPGHESLGAEARALLEVLSTRLEQAAQPTPDPVPDSVPDSAPGQHDSTRCTGCPICAGLTYLKDHRELSNQLAQGALLIVTALRQYLDNSGTGGADTSRPTPATVQHIDIS